MLVSRIHWNCACSTVLSLMESGITDKTKMRDPVGIRAGQPTKRLFVLDINPWKLGREMTSCFDRSASSSFLSVAI